MHQNYYILLFKDLIILSQVTGRNASLTYMKVVERAYFHASDKVELPNPKLAKIISCNPVVNIFLVSNYRNF